ncbi:EAL domain-containing protein [Altererythrobacter sp. KTW20L]|uniref:EAL domain-containing protein n=1 Tax=Altererythrobacter sp. KTW20L TaxID=2942210 RepID=UPI0020C03882|nr:EAL domain-containing protein [Altererythrobacter sp. KTW20L]MCL6252350.1 EAL domain-containing protein [Altererythrobacter sp. KTW20L]
MTPLKEENQQLLEQNAQLRARVNLLEDAIENVRHAICVFDREGRIAFCNRRYPQAVGLPPERVLPGTSARELIQMAWDLGYYPPGRTLDAIEQDFWSNLDSDRTTCAQIDRGGRSFVIHPGRTSGGNLVATFEDITVQLSAESALRKSEASLNAMLDAMPDCVKIFDAEANLIYINPAGLRLLEIPNLEALAASGHVSVPTEYLPMCIDVHQRVLAGKSTVWAYEIVGMNGTRRSVEAHAVPFRFPDGADGHLSITRDISERKSAENALRRSEERLRLIQEASGLADFENDGGEVTVCSDKFFEQVGLPVGDNTISIWDWLNLVHPEDRVRLQKEMEEARVDADVFDSEYRIVRVDNGEIRWISCRTKLLCDDNGSVVRTIGAHRDITHRKQFEIALQESEQRLRLVHDITGLAEFWAAGDGLAHVSERLLEQLGLPPGSETLPFEALLARVHPDDREMFQAKVDTSIAGDDTFECDFRVIHGRTGEERWIHSRTRMQRDANGQIVHSIGAHLDITDRKGVEQVLRESEERFRLAAEAAGLGVWDYDPATDTREWSGRLLDILGLPADTEPSLETAANCVHPEDRQSFLAMLDSAHRDMSSVKFEETFRFVRADNHAERWVTINCWKTRRAEKSLDRIILTLRDVTAEKSAEERIRWSASHDALTGLANRTQFHERLEQATARSNTTGRPFGLLLLDLDHFKQINDTLGHDVGDQLLQMFADRLRSVVRPDDIIARLGGDEFAIILSEVKEPHRLAELSASIQHRLREPFVHKGRVLDCFASIGGAVFPRDGEGPEKLMKNADVALYSAKNSGRSTTKIYEPRLRREIERRVTMVHLAREAIRDNRVMPYYQPKFDLRSREILGFEALLRWRTPGGQVQLPEKFEAAFEDLNVAASLTDRMVEQTIANMRQWLDLGLDFGHVAINTSAADFRRENFAERVLEQLEMARIPTSMFQIEVTETVFLGRGAEYVHGALAHFSAAGVRIALDDFGTGYASLRHLKEFPVDIIKIDRTFVRHMESDPGDDAIVRAVINLGQSLGLDVIAEGVEVESQVEHLLLHGCRYGQGFLLDQARPADIVPSLLARPLRAGPVAPPATHLKLVRNARGSR